MKIALISEPPFSTTGFGVNCGHLVELLAQHPYDVVCFGVGALGRENAVARSSCRVVPMPLDQREALVLLPRFLQDEQPDVLFVHYDLGAVCRFVEVARAHGWRGPVVAHFVIDGIPFAQEEIDMLQTVEASITPTHAAANYVRGQGIERVIAAPHPVDPAVFHPLAERAALRRGAGLADRFVVGVFGRNTERKQQPRTMLALQQLLRSGQADDIVLYMHCQPEKESPWLGGWNLRSLARQLDIDRHVLFPDQNFHQIDGIPYHRAHAARAPGDARDQPSMPADYSYVERLNCCDLIVNVPYSGAFELVLLEGQSCGVPVAGTNDRGAMAEVVGDSALLLEPIDVGIHSSGGYQHFVAASTIAAAIVAVKGDAALRAQLIRSGHANAAGYTIEPLRAALDEALGMAMGRL
jgi:glycosyltransferase involved in cell wall biosynthesis